MTNPTLNPLNAILDQVENGDLITLDRFNSERARNPDLVEILEIHFKYEMMKWDAEQEHLADFLEQWEASDHPSTQAAPEPKHLNALLHNFSTINRMEEMPEEQGEGFYLTCDKDRDLELERYHPASRGLTFAARIAQCNIDKPNYRASFNELRATYAEQNAEACRSLLGVA